MPAAVFLPTLGIGPTLVWGAKALVSGWTGNLYRLKRMSDNATLDVTPISSTNPLPDYAALLAWVGGFYTDVRAVKVYDQSGGGWDSATTADANAPRFDIGQAFNGCAPFLFDSIDGAAFGGPSVTPKVHEHTADAFSINRQAVSIFDVLDPFTTSGDNTLWDLRSASATTSILAASTSIGSPGFVIVGNAAYIPSTFVRSQPCVLGIVSSATDVTSYANETSTSRGSAFTSATIRRFLSGNRNSSSSYYARLRRWGTVIYGAALNSTDANLVLAALRTTFGIRSSFDKRLIFMGDSIMEQYGWDDTTNLMRTVAVTGHILGSWGNAEVYNLAQSSDLWNAQSAALPGTLGLITTHATPLYTAAYGAGKCILICNTGHNDIGFGRSLAQINTDRASAVTSWNANGAGAKYIQETILPEKTWNPGSLEDNKRLDVNIAIRAKTSGEDSVADAVANTTVGDDASTDDVTLYPDGSHPSRIINALRAPIIAAAL